MYSVLRKTLSSALIALLLIGMAFQAAAEAAAPSDAIASQAVAEVSATALESSSIEQGASEAPEAEAETAPEFETDEAEIDEQIDEDELVEILDEQIPLAGGPAPSVTVRADRDVDALTIGDSLVLTCEVSGLDKAEYAVRWQARVNGQWKDLPGERADTLLVRITEENADWAYRAAVDARPA